MFFSLNASASVLPDVLFRDAQERALMCQKPAAQRAEFWRELVSDKLHSQLRGTDLPLQKNALVSEGYLELFRHSGHPSVRLMGYVYAHASHHLGRLVRYHHWSRVPRNDERAQVLKAEDLRLIQGETLRRLVATFPRPLAARLMDFSLDLYETLTPPLLVMEVCGVSFAQRVFPGTHLQEAFGTRHPLSFMHHFVEYEQTYLQSTMYRQVDIRLLAQQGVLDEMRFIPFNGEVTASFAEWCRAEGCGATSLDLRQRIEFDRWAIEQEWAWAGGEFTELEQRLRASPIEEIQDYVRGID